MNKEMKDKCDHCLDSKGKLVVANSTEVLESGKNMDKYQFTCVECCKSWTCWFGKYI
jgi:hypothetical protein